MRIFTYVSPGQFWLFALLLVTVAIYYPALDSLFLLDDYPNLDNLRQIESHGYWHYIFSGIASPSGRPLSLLSFALQYQHWPANPFAFKLVNLLIHLLNGVLIFLICRLLATRLDLSDGQTTALGILSTSLWLLHPIQISTVLYVVQRMTQLSACCVLFSLWVYLRSRIRYQDQYRGLLVMSIAVVLGTILGVLSKENAILLPLYILVAEYTVLSDLPKSRRWKAWAVVSLILPLLILLVYLAVTLDSTLSGYHGKREFTAIQRLLTQPIILFDYIRALILPHPDIFSLFHDDYPFATGWTKPLAALLASIGWMVCIIFALLYRKGSLAVIAFAILWFVSGHLLEASHLNLELYFEHRNYLPCLGIFFMLAWLAILAWRSLSNKRLAGILILGFYGLVLAISLQQLQLWKDPYKQASTWHRLHPESARSLNRMADMQLAVRENEQAIQSYHRLKEIHPLDLYPHIRELNIRMCMLNEDIDEQRFWGDIFDRTVKAKNYSASIVGELDQMTSAVLYEGCQLDPYKLLRLIVALALDEDFIRYKHYFHELAALLALHMGAKEAALENITAAIEHKPMPNRYALKIRILFALAMIKEAKMAIDEFKQFLGRHPGDWLANRKIVSGFESQWLELQANPVSH